MPDGNFYGIALDGHGDLCRVFASNAGHLLAFGLPDAERGAAVAGVLGSALFQTGWGIRTLAAGQPRFNPMAYHNGSVWPHDNALIARGLARYGDKTAAVNLLRALFEAAVSFEMRLPELFCGFRAGGRTADRVSGGCLPQAWAAGAPFMMLQACLGVSIDASRHEVRVERPTLPEGVDWLRIDALRVGDETVSLTFRRVDGCRGGGAAGPREGGRGAVGPVHAITGLRTCLAGCSASKERRLAEPNKRRATPQCGRQGTFPCLEKSFGVAPEGPIASCSSRIRRVFASQSLRSALLGPAQARY